MRDRLPDRQLPTFEVGLALHCGPVGMAHLEGFLGGSSQRLPVGGTVVNTMAIQRLAPHTQGAMVMSVPAVRSLMGAVKVVERYFLSIDPSKSDMEVCAVRPINR